MIQQMWKGTSPSGSLDPNNFGADCRPKANPRPNLLSFKETSAESFEQSLMTRGYGTYGAADNSQLQVSPKPATPREPQSVPNHAFPELSPQNLERQKTKQRRLASFTQSLPHDSRLHVVEVEGRGRVLLSSPILRQDEQPYVSPPKKRKKRKTGDQEFSKVETVQEPILEIDTPNWLDNEFPWCLKQEERPRVVAADAERLACIENFLERDTDEDSEDDGEGSVEGILPSALWGQLFEDPPLPSRRGRGKMVPLRAESTSVQQPSRTQNVFFPSDPADARAALLSKRNVRSLAQRRQLARRAKFMQVSIPTDGVVKCICGDGDDGTPQVQCDHCRMWYHLDCLGIRDEEELGAEDDPWYCFECSRTVQTTQTPSPGPLYSRQPIFAPTDTTPLYVSQSEITFLHSSPFNSPHPSNSPLPPHTPTRHRDGHEPHSKALWDMSGSGPRTPHTSSRDIPIFTTPSSKFDYYQFTNELPFDPTSTPSRGINLGLPFVTPKSIWHTPANGILATPRAGPGGARGPTSQSSEEGSSFSRFFDDSPIRRAPESDIRRAQKTRCHTALSPPFATHSSPVSLTER